MRDPRGHEIGGMGWGTKLVLAGFALGAVMMLGLIALSFIVPRAIDRAIERYTDVAPSAAARPAIGAEERAAVEERLEAFDRALDAGEAREPLVLTEREVNALLAEALEDTDEASVGVELLPGRVRAELSLRLTQSLPLGPWTRDLSGRYLNGTATFEAAVRSGALELHLARFEVKGRPLPERVLKVLRAEIGRSGVLEDRDTREFVEKIGGLEFGAGRVTIRPPAR